MAIVTYLRHTPWLPHIAVTCHQIDYLSRIQPSLSFTLGSYQQLNISIWKKIIILIFQERVGSVRPVKFGTEGVGVKQVSSLK